MASSDVAEDDKEIPCAPLNSQSIALEMSKNDAVCDEKSVEKWSDAVVRDEHEEKESSACTMQTNRPMRRMHFF